MIGPILSKLDEKEQKKEWHHISTLGNIEELRRIASDTAGSITLYYREQIQFIDSSQKIQGSNAFNDKVNSVKQIIDVRPESSEEMAVVMVAEYITSWIIHELKFGKDTIVASEPLPQQFWLCVAKSNPMDHGKTTKLTDIIGMPNGQQKIALKSRNLFDKEVLVQVQLRHLIGCVSVVGNNGSIYQYSVPKNSSEKELEDLEVFGYVYVTPFLPNEKALQSIVEGRKLQLAKWDDNGNILTRFEDIVEYAQTYAVQNDEHVHDSLITKETANLVADVIRDRKIFVDCNDFKEELRAARETIELSVDVLREEIQEKTKFYQISIDAAHEQIKQESKVYRETTEKEDELRQEQTREKIHEKLKEIQNHLEQLIESRLHKIEQYMQEKTRQILTIAETAQVQSLEAVAEVVQTVQFSQQLLQKVTQATTSAQNLLQRAEQQQEQFQLAIMNGEALVKETAQTEKELCERAALEMRTKCEYVCGRANEAVQESAANIRASAQAARQSAQSAQDVQKLMKNQLELQRKETDRIIAEAREARQQSGRAVVEGREAQKQAKRAADASVAAGDKMNSIHYRVEKALKQLEKVTKSLTTPV